MWPIRTEQFKKLGLESFVPRVHKIKLWFSEFGISEILNPVDNDWRVSYFGSKYGRTLKNLYLIFSSNVEIMASMMNIAAYICWSSFSIFKYAGLKVWFNGNKTHTFYIMFSLTISTDSLHCYINSTRTISTFHKK